MRALLASRFDKMFAPAAMWIVILAIFAHAFAYAHAVANPLLSDDNWTFVDTFLREVLEGRLDFGDFLVKRAGFDHGQPLNKLAMLLNERYFDLDFAFETKLGLLFAVFGFLVIHRTAIVDSDPSQRDFAFRAAMVAIAAIYVSLNNNIVFIFSLVTMGYVLYVLAFIAFYAAWTGLNGAPRWHYAVAILMYAIAGDTSTVIAGVAIAMAAAWYGWRLGRGRRACELIILTITALLISDLVYQHFGAIRGSTQAVFNVPPGEHIAGLMAQWNDGWRWAIVPLAAGLAHVGQLQSHFPSSWQAIQIVLGILLAGLHVWFWIEVYRTQPRAARFLAVVLMLSFYGYVAGIVWGRVFVRGAVFLDHMHYILFYQLHVIALLLMGAARRLDMPSALTKARAGRVLIIAACLVLAVQIPISMHAWASVKYIRLARLQVATEYGQLARAPSVLPPCGHWRNFCRMTKMERARTVETLRRYRLNLYSPRFAKAHPELAQAAGQLPD